MGIDIIYSETSVILVRFSAGIFFQLLNKRKALDSGLKNYRDDEVDDLLNYLTHLEDWQVHRNNQAAY